MATINHQYEAPKLPGGWTADEKRFYNGVIDVFDDIYRRWGRLGEKDLSAKLRTLISDKADGETVTSLTTRIEQTESEIALKASSETVNALGERVSTAETSITQNATAISSKASQSDVNALGERVTTAESEIRQTPDRISAAVSGMRIGGTNLLHGISVWGIIDGEGFGYDSSGASAMGTYVAQNDGSLLVTNSGSNVRAAHSGIAVQPGEVYTVSAEYKDISGECPHQFQMVFQDSSGEFVGNAVSEGDKTTLADGWVKSVFTFTIPDGTAKLSPCFRSGTDYTLYTHQYYIRHPKLERGNKATDWSPNPNELRDVKVGSNILMDTEHTEINTPYLDIDVSGTEGDMHIDENGISAGTATFETLNCPGVVKYYTGAASITLGAGSDVSAISNALSNCMLTYDVKISVTGDINGALAIKGLCGSGNVIVMGGGHTLNGYILMSNNGCRVYIESLKISKTAATRPCVAIDRCAEVRLYGCVLNANNVPSNAQGVQATYSKLFLQNCEFYNIPDSAMSFSYFSDVLMLACKGAATYCMWADGATVRFAGSRPSGKISYGNPSFLLPADPSTVPVDTGSAAPVEPAVTTESYTASVTGTYYPSGHWINDNTIRQGHEGTGSSARRDYGCMWFNAGTLAGKTIKSATLTIKRISGKGRSSSVALKLWTTTLTGKSGKPTDSLVNLGEIGKIANGETATFNVPVSAISVIAAGGGLVLYTEETTNKTGKNYSENYAHFEGVGGSAPVLTVTYQ